MDTESKQRDICLMCGSENLKPCSYRGIQVSSEFTHLPKQVITYESRCRYESVNLRSATALQC